eukprot:scaffold109324_cov60-Phaeocystis_antarctica.AAC.1
MLTRCDGAPCFYAGVNPVSCCSAALVRSLCLSSASTLLRRRVHSMRLSRGGDTMSPPVIGVGFAPSPCSLDATVRHASMLASTASRVAVLHCVQSRPFGHSCHVGPRGTTRAFGHCGDLVDWIQPGR